MLYVKEAHATLDRVQVMYEHNHIQYRNGIKHGHADCVSSTASNDPFTLWI